MAVVESGAPVEAGASTPKGFEINGKLYAFPRIDTITLDEERILYVYADTVLQDFTPAHPDMSRDEQIMYETLQMRKIRNPDFKRALAHIAYKRENPHVQDSDIQVTIGGVSALEVDLAMLRGDDDDPPAMTSQKPLENKSDTNELSRPTDSGSPTESTSVLVVENPEGTGTIELETFNHGAAPTELVS
jgi:hypothetical protein